MLISLQQVVEKHEFVKFGPVAVVCTVLNGLNKFLSALSIFLNRFCEKMLSTNHTLFMGMNEDFPSFLHSASDSDIIRYRKYKYEFTEWLGIF